MEAEKQKLGPIQTEWVKTLREHPERQLKGSLGKNTEDGLKLCCLGQGLLVVLESEGKAPLWVDGKLLDITSTGSNYSDSQCLGYSYEKLGLKDKTGVFYKDKRVEIAGSTSLAALNDGHGDYEMDWYKIADVIEQNPELIFSHSL